MTDKYCLHCGKLIPKERGGKYSRWKVKWCSEACANRAYRRRNGQEEAFSFKVEEYVKGILGIKIDRKAKIDTEYNGKTIDIKGSRPYVRKNRADTIQWTFSRTSKEQLPDYFLCICYDGGENPIKSYMIPGDVFPRSGITAGDKSKWDKYLTKVKDVKNNL